LRDVLEGVQHLHYHNVAHRDIKPENIVISNVIFQITQDVCKICDLGTAAICEDRRRTMCCTIDYASPELLEGKEYDIAIDLWCLGVLCFELMAGKCPFYHISRKETMKKIINVPTATI
jgi:serine/threonine protein kinase